MDYREKIDQLLMENETLRGALIASDRTNAPVDVSLLTGSLRIAGEFAAFNEYLLVRRDADLLEAKRRETSREEPNENAIMDVAAWIEALLGAWCMGGYAEFQKIAPYEAPTRKKIASGLATYADGAGGLLATAMAWWLDPTAPALAAYVSRLADARRCAAASALILIAGEAALPPNQNFETIESEANAELKIRAEELARSRSEGAALWATVAPELTGERLLKIQFSIISQRLIARNERRGRDLRGGRLRADLVAPFANLPLFP